MCLQRPMCQRFCLKFCGTSKRWGHWKTYRSLGVSLKKTVGTLCLPLPPSLPSYALSIALLHTLHSGVRSQHRSPKQQDCSPKPPTLNQVTPFLLGKLIIRWMYLS